MKKLATMFALLAGLGLAMPAIAQDEGGDAKKPAKTKKVKKEAKKVAKKAPKKAKKGGEEGAE